MTSPNYTTITAAAEHFGITRQMVHSWVKRLGLGKEIGGRILLTNKDMKVLASRPKQGRPRKIEAE